MRHLMRQSRDGITQIIDAAPNVDAEPIAGPLGWWARLRWTGILVWFMRTLAWVWLAKGLSNWTIVLGVGSRFGDFTMLPQALQATIVFFAVVDLLAAVGLWLAAPWGGVLWLLCAVIEAISPVLGARGALVRPFEVALDMALIAIYFALSWFAGRERD